MHKSILHKLILPVAILVLYVNANAQALSGTKTIGSGGTYASLTAAFAAATTNGISAPVIFELLSSYTSSVETSFPITIGVIGGSSATNTITVRPQSGATGLSINSASATATIDLNGATNIIIDGRPGGTGAKNLVINNSNTTSGLAVRFINDACFNTIKYAVLSGQNTATTGGVIFFGGTTGSRGNDSNTVDNCDIRDDNGNTPTTAVYGSGSTAGTTYYNSNNFITNNNIFNFWNASASEVNCFKVSAGNTDWVITGNSMYQTSTRVPASAFQLYFFNMNNNAANNHIMNNNYMGGSAPQCGGSPFTVNATVGFRITGAYLSVGVTVPSSFSGNTFANFDITSGTASYPGIPGVVSGPWLVGGLFIVNNNTFGSMTSTGSIKVTNAIAGNVVYPIGISTTSAGVMSIKGNNFGGIDIQGTNTSNSASLQCIGITSATTGTTYLIDSNVFGNPIADNLICSTPSVSATTQSVMAIYNSAATCNINARGNIIRNMRNNAIGSGAGNSYFTHGIDIGAGGIDTITGNIIYNLSNAALYQNNNTGSAAILGIRLTPTSSGNVLSQNQVYGLHLLNNGAATVTATGIIINNMTSTRVDRNFIHSMNALSTSGASLAGLNIAGGSPRVYNNMVRLGIDTAGASVTTAPVIYGIVRNGGNISLLNNSVFIGGSGVGSTASNTYAFISTAAGTDTIYNNIFSNERSNSSTGGTHYAINLNASTGMLEDYNNLWTNGTGGALGLLGANNYSSVSAWNAAAGVDANSSAISPGFKVQNGTAKTVDLHIAAGLNKGTNNANLNVDYDGDVRNNPPDIGADEIPYDVGVLSIDSPTSVSFCGKSRNIWVTFKNFGPTTITNVVFNMNVNGAVANAYTWSGSLASGATSASTNIGAVNFIGGNYVLAVNSTLPNGKLDNNITNDTAKVSFSVTPTVIPTLSISTANSTVCINSAVTFKAAFTNGGSTPVFSWKKNSSVVGTNDSSYSSSTLANNDTISVTLTSNATCANPATLTSNQIKMTVGVTLPPSVTINNNGSTICPGGAVSFTAATVNGGTTPHYQWQKNGSNVGSDSVGYVTVNPANSDSIRCIMTSTLSCASKPKDTSAYTKVTVNPTLVPSAIISATSLVICAGVSDTFTSVLTNSGTSPVYQWRKNGGTAIGSNNGTYISSALSNGDSIYLQLISNALCANPSSVNSNKIGITVAPTVSPSASITVTKNSLCAGDSVKFVASYSNGGNSPLRQWYKNSTLFQSGVDSFTTLNISNKDTIYFKLTSNAPCLVKTTASSNQQLMTVNPVVTPSVTMSATATTICSGTSVQFTAVPVNGGTAPHFVWRKSGVIIGSDSTKFTTNLLSNKDSVWVILTSNAPCAVKTNDTSAKVTMTVNPTVTPTLSVSTGNNTFCPGTKVAFNATATNTGTTPHYQWYKNSTLVGTDSTYFAASTFADRDTVYATLNSSVACPTVNNIKSNKVILLMLPTVSASVTISGNANNVCKGTPVTFTAAPVNGGTPSYQWKINGANSGADNALFITDTLKNGDSVSVQMTSTASCAVPTVSSSNKIGMTIKPSVIPHVTISASKNNICPGDVITFTATDSNGGTAPSHTWLKFNTPTGSDSVTFTSAIVSSQTIQCILTTNVACPTKTKDTASFVVNVKPLPVKPIITRNWDTLTSTVAPSYQWIFNNANLTGETNQKLTLTQNGNYKVTVDSNGCKNTSDVYAFTFIGIAESADFGTISLAPNPTTGFVHLNAQFKTTDATLLQVMDMTGRLIEQAELGNISTINNHTIDLSILNSGAYLIYIKHGDQFEVRKVVRGE